MRRLLRGLEWMATLAILVVAVRSLLNYEAAASRSRSTRPLSNQDQRQPLPAVPIRVDHAPFKGNLSSPAALIVFADFQCPFCKHFATTVLPTLTDRYVRTGRLLVAFKYLPLKIHREAMKAARAADCAYEQHRFWEMHDALFQRQADLPSADMKSVASAIGLDLQAFDACTSTVLRSAVQRDVFEAKVLSVSKAPTMFVGRVSNGAVIVTQRFIGSATVDQLAAAIDSAAAPVK